MTKLQLLQHITQEDIIKFYLPDFDPHKTDNYHSPFSFKDDKPSLSFYTEENNWKFKSHNTDNQGDVFQFVADLKKIDCKNDFNRLIDEIARDLQLNGYSNNLPDKGTNPVKPENHSKNISISYEPELTEAFVQYFSQYKITPDCLIKFNVKQVKFHHFISKKGRTCKIDYKAAGKVVACYIIQDRIKLYIPKIQNLQEKEFGFKNQKVNDIFGLEQISQDRPKTLLIAAGEKDCLALNSNGFSSISFQSENHFITEDEIFLLKNFSKQIFIVYDNDEPGKKAAKKVCNKYQLKSIVFPENIKDSADFFRDHTAEDFQKLIDTAVTVNNEDNAGITVTSDDPADEDEETKDSYTIFHATEKFLSKHYDLRFNTVKLELEISDKNKNSFGALNENDLFIKLNKQGVRVGMDKLLAILKSSFVQKFNPIHEYFRNLPKWDGHTDHIQELCHFVKCDEHEEFSRQFAKWLMRCVRCALIEGYYNKQAFILVHSLQNSGKSTFCRFLVPSALKEYSAENISDDKDSRIALAKNFIINLDELSSLAKHEINSLKSLFSKDLINERLPYDRKNSIIHRVASFIGSTNMAEFLTDETGSVRWLCFEIKSIDWKYSKSVDINKVWSQAFWMIKEGLESDMNKKDIEENEKRNEKFQQLSSEAEMIPQFLKPATENELSAVFLSSTEILIYLASFTSIRLNKIMVGRAMPICGFFRQKESKTDRYGYWCIKLK